MNEWMNFTWISFFFKNATDMKKEFEENEIVGDKIEEETREVWKKIAKELTRQIVCS